MVYPTVKKDFNSSGIYTLNSINGLKSHFSVVFELLAAMAMKTPTNISEPFLETSKNFDGVQSVT
jgi:hypothetical protein